MSDAGHHLQLADRCVFCACLAHGASLRKALSEGGVEYFITGLISLTLGVYLLYALLRPEKFCP